MPVLQLGGITKDYGRRRILRGVDLSLEEGQRALLVGPNGSGKSTLLAIAATVVRPTGGTVHVQGLDAARTPDEARRHVGWLPQSPALYPDLTPLEHLRWARRMHGSRAGDPTAAATAAGLGDAMFRPCRALSGGQRQRTALALATLHQPSLLLLDEPEQALDEDGRDWLARTLDAHEGAVLAATHAPQAPASKFPAARHPDMRTVRLP